MTLYVIVHWIFSLYTMMLVVNIFSSWFRELDQFTVIRFVKFYTEPYLALFRRIIPPIGVLDISPILAFFALRILEGCILGVLFP